MYELMTITKIAIGEDKAKEISTNVQKLISSLGGKVEKTDFWGKRKFAYPIKHSTEGFYDVINFDLGKEKVALLKSKLNLMQEVLRYLFTAL